MIEKTLLQARIQLREISLFHACRGNACKNQVIDSILKHNNIERSLSPKGSPVDNAVAEAIFKISKKEFERDKIFASREELKTKLFYYIN